MSNISLSKYKSEYFETKSKWGNTGRLNYDKKPIFCWLCIYCSKESEMKYIATGHDHTDYDYEICNCEGARKNGRPYNKLI